jgi:hypothetical protein
MLYFARYNFEKIQRTVGNAPRFFRIGERLKSPDSSLVDFISKEQTKETDEGDKSNSVVYGRCVQRPMETSD